MHFWKPPKLRVLFLNFHKKLLANMKSNQTRRVLRGTITALAALSVSACALLPESKAPVAEVPETEEILGWISTIDAQGIRRPGWPADAWIEDWAIEKFHSFGVQDVEKDPIEVVRWKENSWSLKVWPKGQPENATELASWPIPLSESTAGLEGDLVLSQKGQKFSPGEIAVAEISLMEFPQNAMRDKVATWHHDPDGDFDTLVQTVPMSSRWQAIMEPEMKAGAGAVIMILDFPWETRDYYVPYDAKPRGIPGLYLSRSDGAKLKAMMAEGEMEARIEVDREMTKVINHNIVATLPGRSDEWIIIGSHHDGPWNSAVEDASGVSLVMAQAKYWAQVPESERPHNLLFLLNGGHMSKGAGLQHFAKTRKDFLSNKVVTAIHLEHAARQPVAVDGKLVPSDKPEVRWWFTSYIPTLENIVAKAICEQNLGRSLMMPSTDWPRPGAKHPPTDGSAFFFTTPAVNYLTAPMYLFDSVDRMDMIHEESLVPVTQAVISIVEDLGPQTAAGLRSGAYKPPKRGAVPSCEALGASVAESSKETPASRFFRKY